MDQQSVMRQMQMQQQQVQQQQQPQVSCVLSFFREEIVGCFCFIAVDMMMGVMERHSIISRLDEVPRPIEVF